MIWETANLIQPEGKRLLSGIERRGLVILAVFLVASGFFRSFWLSSSLAMGGVISMFNFWGLRTIIEKALNTRPRFLLALFIKFLLLLGVLFLLIVYANVHKVAFAVGLSVAFISITWEGFKGHRKVNGEG